MARIPEADIERLKNEVNVERLVEASGIGLKRGGKDRLGRCSFHEDGRARDGADRPGPHPAVTAYADRSRRLTALRTDVCASSV
jgi:hypothetical protein